MLLQLCITVEFIRSQLQTIIEHVQGSQGAVIFY